MAEEVEIKGESSYGRILYYPTRTGNRFVFEKKTLDSRGNERYVQVTSQHEKYKIRETIANGIK